MKHAFVYKRNIMECYSMHAGKGPPKHQEFEIDESKGQKGRDEAVGSAVEVSIIVTVNLHVYILYIKCFLFNV